MLNEGYDKTGRVTGILLLTLTGKRIDLDQEKNIMCVWERERMGGEVRV